MRRHFQVRQNFVDRMRAQIPARQTFQEYLKFLPSRGGQRAEVTVYFIVSVGVHAFVHASVELVRRADVELPEVFRLPGGESLWTNRLDVRMREKAEHFQEIRCADNFRELRDGAGIVDVPAKSRAHIEMACD